MVVSRNMDIGELKVWIEGQFELMKERQNTTNEELGKVRQRIHDFSNDVTKEMALQSGKINVLETWKASLLAVKASYAFGGAFVSGAIVLVLDVLKVIHL